MRCKWGATWIFIDLTPLVLVLSACDSDDIVNGTVRPRQLKWGATWVFHYVTPLVPMLTSCNGKGIENGTIAFIRSRQLKQGETWHFDHVTLLALVSVSHDAKSLSMARLYLLAQDYRDKVQLDILVSPFKTTTSSLSGNCLKSVPSRPSRPSSHLEDLNGNHAKSLPMIS